MSLTADRAGDVAAGATYVYLYRTGVVGNGDRAEYKGKILGYVPRNPTDLARSELFDFLAPNDATAYAYLLERFRPGDARRIQSPGLLESARSGPFRSDNLSCRPSGGLGPDARPANL